jgi:catalase
MDPSPALSIQKNLKPTLKGRTIGILIAEGSDGSRIRDIRSKIEGKGGSVFLIAPKVDGTKLGDGKVLKADGQLSGSPSLLIDAVALVLSEKGTQSLLKESAALQFIADAFTHLKAIGHTDAARPLLDKAGVILDDGITDLGPTFLDAAAKRFWDRESKLRDLA